MKFEIKCDTFTRLASICSFFDPKVPLNARHGLETVRLERVKGRTIAVVTNRCVMAIEVLPQHEQAPDSVCHINLHPAILTQCKMESFLNSRLFIETVPEIAIATAKTSSGWTFAGNACHWFDETPLNSWRNVIPKKNASKSLHVMEWSLAHIQALFESSPTGKVYFPQHIDASQPICLRDSGNESWVGIFIPSVDYNYRKNEAKLPEWII